MTDVHVMAQALEEDLLFACANWISGPAVEDCIQHAKALAQKIYSIRPSFQ
jgi:oxygen-dependent protoporphyrinogen oxidase